MKKQKNTLFNVFAIIIMLIYVFFYFFESPEHYSNVIQYELYKSVFQFGNWLGGSIGIILQLLPLILVMFYISKKNYENGKVIHALILGVISLKPIHNLRGSYGTMLIVVAVTVVAICLELANKTKLTVPMASILFVLCCALTILDIIAY